MTDLLVRNGPRAAAASARVPRPVPEVGHLLRARRQPRIGASRSTNSAASENVQPPLALTRLTQIRRSPALLPPLPSLAGPTQRLAVEGSATDPCDRPARAFFAWPRAWCCPYCPGPCSPPHAVGSWYGSSWCCSARPSSGAPGRDASGDVPRLTAPLPSKTCKSVSVCSWTCICLP